MPEPDSGPGNVRASLAPGQGNHPRTIRKKGAHTKQADRIEILGLAKRGISQTEIARVVGVTQQTVSYICRQHDSTCSIALGVLQASAHQAAQQWVKT